MTTIESGNYSVLLTGAQLGETNKGDAISSISVKHVSPSPYAGHADAWDGWLNNDKAFEQTGKTLRECLWTGDDITDVTFPENTIAQAVYQAGNDGVVRLKYMNGPGRAPRNKPLAADKVSDVRDRMRAALAALGSATAAPAVSEKLRPFLSEANKITDATAAARLWKTFGDKIATWSKDDQNTAWSALCQRVPGAQIKTALDALKKPAAAPSMNGAEAPPF